MRIEDAKESMLLSVDPGSDSAWALWCDDQITSYGLKNGDNIFAMYRLIGGLSKKYPHLDKTLVIEDQYIGINWVAAKTLISRRCRWTAVAELFRWEVHLIQPSVWQVPLFKLMSKDVDTKIRSLVVARSIEGVGDIKSHDLADALCIGHYWIKRASFPVAPKRKKAKKKKGKKTCSKQKKSKPRSTK